MYTNQSKVILLIADISGYTNFMLANRNTISKSHKIIIELIKAIIEHIELPLEVAKIEGDAVFLFALKGNDEKEWEVLRKKIGEKNKKEGEDFLAENKKKEGVQTLPSGLQYKVIKAGTGKKPQLTDTVTTQYRGTLIDGTEFDSSYRRGKPATFPVNGVIRGWTEALQLMEEGAKWELFVPPDLAYGERGAGQQIGPNATLIFEIELISIQEKK